MPDSSLNALYNKFTSEFTTTKLHGRYPEDGNGGVGYYDASFTMNTFNNDANPGDSDYYSWYVTDPFVPTLAYNFCIFATGILCQRSMLTFPMRG